MKRIIANLLTLAMLTLATLPLAGCDKTSLNSAAADIVQSLKDARPLLEQALPSAAAEIGQAIDIADKLQAAVAKSEATTAVGYLGDLIPTFQVIVRDDIPQIKDAATRTLIMAALALANIGLHFLVNNLNKSAPTAMAAARPGPKAAAVHEFAREPVWGEQFKRKRGK